MSEEKLRENEFHEKIAKSLFNQTWNLIEKKDRTEEEDFEMVHSTHASSYHWSKIGKPINFQRGEWQVSRVYAILNKPEGCLYHAQRCMNLTKQHNIKGFDLTFAYEALARAYSVGKNNTEKEKYLKLAMEAAELIKDEEDKKYVLSELTTIT